jgi:hypothetical protein
LRHTLISPLWLDRPKPLCGRDDGSPFGHALLSPRAFPSCVLLHSEIEGRAAVPMDQDFGGSFGADSVFHPFALIRNWKAWPPFG